MEDKIDFTPLTDEERYELQDYDNDSENEEEE